MPNDEREADVGRREGTRDIVVLVTSGASLLLTQYVAVRELGSTFFSTELVLFAATFVTLGGPSIGYALAHRVSDRALAAWGFLAVLVQIALPTGVRGLVSLAAPAGLLGLALGASLALSGLVVCGFYSVFLPKCTKGPRSLPVLYAAELAGALGALAFASLLASYRWVLAAHSSFAVTAFVLAMTARPMRKGGAIALVLLVAVTGLVGVSYPVLNRWATESYFARYQSLPSPVVVATEYSPYQRIDVVDDALGSRSLFLDGVYFFRSNAFEGFNVFLADVPGALRGAPGHALVVGSGSFLSASLLYRLGYDVTVVELDEAVARLGFFHFADVHGLVPGAVRVEIADARQYLASTDRTFDIVVLDVPAPYHVRTALLHTMSFYQLVANRLSPGGVASISLCDSATGPIARSIAAGAARVFPSVAIVQPASSQLGHLYAGHPLPFEPVRLERELARDPRGGLVMDDTAVRALVSGVDPIEPTNLAPVLVMARGPLREVLGAH